MSLSSYMLQKSKLSVGAALLLSCNQLAKAQGAPPGKAKTVYQFTVTHSCNQLASGEESGNHVRWGLKAQQVEDGGAHVCKARVGQVHPEARALWQAWAANRHWHLCVRADRTVKPGGKGTCKHPSAPQGLVTASNLKASCCSSPRSVLAISRS